MPISPPPIIGLHKVKLPSPSVSDYITPTSSLSSSNEEIDLSVHVLRRHADGVTNESNIYDDDDGTYALPGSNLAAYETREVMVWDLGSVKTRRVKYRIWAYVSKCYGRIKYSNDDSTYTLLAEAESGAVSGEETVTFRYLKWEVYNGYNTSYPSSDFRLCTLDVWYDSSFLIDDDTGSFWKSNTETNPWARVDTGALKILGGCRIYFPAVSHDFKVAVSEDGSTWEDVYSGSTPGSEGWVECSWSARYARYIRVQGVGSLSMQINEIDYYSKITDRVAAEHGHGSGVTGKIKGHGVRKGFTHREKIKKKLAEGKLTLKDLLEYLDFMLTD